MEFQIWIALNFLIIGLVLGAIIGYQIAKRKSPNTDPQLASQLAALVATEAELRIQLGKAEQALEQQRAAQEQENKVLIQLAPVKDQLAKMGEVVANLEKERASQFNTISEQLRNAVQSDETLRKQTQQLAQALSSNSLRGVWGETQLRKLIELAGLIKHADFSEQVTISTETGSGRVDVVVNLPSGKKLAIDSKVPFNSYQEASAISELATGEELARRERLLDEHVKAFRKHIDDLGSRQYWTGLDSSPDFTICFVPSESLLSAALEADAGLLEYAFKKNVAVASPVTLFSVLKTISHIWRQNADETQLRNLLKLGKELYERVGKMAQLADKLGRSMTTSVKDYNAFVSSLETRMLVTARKLNDLDENELGIGAIESPKEITEAPATITAKEIEG
ncbi:MAG: recombination protein RmuC [Actinomycetota bacterium]|jgi:DNA recombination protein RmuC